MSDSFCVYPFTHLNVKANGHVAVCNRSQPLGRIQDIRILDDFWTCKRVTKLREELLAGLRPVECSACWSLENSGAISYRQEALSGESEHQQWYRDAQAGRLKVREVELRFGNLCNLKCRMCSPKFSSRWESEVSGNESFRKWMEEDEDNRDIYQLHRLIAKDEVKTGNEKVLKFVESNGDQFSYVIFAGGEPLLQKEHYLALELLLKHAHKITLEYSTNLNYLNFERFNVLDLWRRFKKVIIKISLDGDPLIYEYIRDGGSLKSVEKNILQIKSNLDPERVMLLGTCTTSIYNVSRLPEIMNYFQKIGIYGHSSLVQEPDFLSPQILPRPLKDGLRLKIDRYLRGLESLEIFGDRFIEKERQRELMRRWTVNAWRFANGKDLPASKWLRFLEFNAFMDPENKRLFEFYPEWKAYQA